MPGTEDVDLVRRVKQLEDDMQRVEARSFQRQYVRLVRNSQLGIADSGWVPIGYNQTVENIGFTLGGAPITSIACPIPGFYDVYASAGFVTSGTGVRVMAIDVVDGAGSLILQARRAGVAAGDRTMAVADRVHINDVDHNRIAIRVWQNSGGTLNLRAGASPSEYGINSVTVSYAGV